MAKYKPFKKFPNSRTVSVEGLRKAQKNMDPKLMMKFNRRLFEQIGNKAVDRARRLVSGRSKAPSGRLGQSISYRAKVRKGKSELAIGSNLNYAHIQEYGTGSGFDGSGGGIQGRVRQDSYFPNIESRRFRRWLGRTGIQREFAWVVGRAIAENGIEAKRYLRDSLTKALVMQQGRAVGERYWR